MHLFTYPENHLQFIPSTSDPETTMPTEIHTQKTKQLYVSPKSKEELKQIGKIIHPKLQT